MSTEIQQFEELRTELTQLVAPTLAIKVSNTGTSATAIEAAKQVKTLQKRIEAKRKDLVGPLNDRVKLINEYAKSIMAPLEQAESHLKRELVSFELEQEKIRLEEMRKAEDERRRIEAELQAKHDAEQAALVDDAQVADVFGADDNEPSVGARALDLEIAQQEEIARARMAAKQREYDAKSIGIKNARKTWKCEATDISKVPKEFLIITLNSAAVLAAARAGVTEIAGVRLWQETSIAIGANTYVPAALVSK
jgi:hypothetical protein